ncbi:MAG: ROK family transcriptional regulator [Spirochaetales bacterium]|nr:ROK family transcriptional regulator [Spirochaetales bacterium]
MRKTKNFSDLDSVHAKQLQVLNFVREKDNCTRTEIAEALDIDKKTVSTLVRDLSNKLLIESAGYKDSQVGRRQEILRLNGAHSNFIGIDLGATHVIGILVNLRGEVVDRVYFEIRPQLPVKLILEQMKTVCQTLIKSQRATAEIPSIGLCVPGFVNPDTGISVIAENIPGWRDVRIREIFEQEQGKPVYVEDCSRAAGFAERWLGEGKQAKDFLTLDLGYGIGMSLFLNRELYTGSGYKAGEIGHSVVKLDGTECTCGKRGCLETVASGRGIARQAASGIAEKRSELLERLTHGKCETVTAHDVAIAASMNDEYSVALLREAGRYIGAATANAVNLLDPQLLILGGGLVNAGSILIDSIKESLKQYTMMGIAEDIEIRVSKLGVDSSALGIALIAMDRIFCP